MEAEVIISEREVIIHLLELYKNLPCLWDTKHEDYSNKEVRNHGFSIMLDVFKKLDSAATMKTLKNKLENMRTSYKRERKKVVTSLYASGDNSGEIHTPSLWYYQYLTFLDEKPDSTEGIDHLESLPISTRLSDENFQQHTKKRKIESSNLRENELLKRQEALIKNARKLLGPGEESSADAFGRSISSQLKELPKLQRCLAEKLMSEVMFHAKLDQLNVNTTINVNHDPSPRDSTL